MRPEISIIVPIYNVEKYLEQCLDSILAQSFKNFEVLLINDGSTDFSGDICDRYVKLDSRFKVYHKKNEGVSSARNIGVKNSRGKYTIFVDSDDYITENYCKVLKEEIESSATDIVVCKIVRKVPEIDSLDYSKTIFSRNDSLVELFKGEYYRFSPCAKIYKTEIIKKYRFPEGKIHEDLATIYKYFLEVKSIAYIDYIGYIYFYRENSILTKKYNSKRLDAFIHWKEILELTKEESKQVLNSIYKRYLYWIVDNIFYILLSDKKEIVKLDYYKSIKKNIKNTTKLFYYNLTNFKHIITLLLFLIKS